MNFSAMSCGLRELFAPYQRLISFITLAIMNAISLASHRTIDPSSPSCLRRYRTQVCMRAIVALSVLFIGFLRSEQ